jgi:uncharacterized protein YjbI with pentapeptide repeats
MDQDLEQTRYWRALRRKITKHFSLGEVKVLCQDVTVDYDELSGEEKVEKVSNLIGYLARRGRLADLIQLLKEERSKVDWEESIPTPEQQIQDAEKLIPLAKDDLILREYLEKLQQYLPPDALEKAQGDRRLQEVIYKLTKTYMRQLDLWRRTRLVRHLGENNLQTVVSLGDINLAGADLSGVNLQGANLAGAILIEAFLAHANLQETILTGANLDGALLANSNLQRAILVGANLEDASLYRANLREANLSQAILRYVDLSEADLTDSILEHVSNKREDIISYWGHRNHDEPKLAGAIINTPVFLLSRAESELKNGNFKNALKDAGKLCELDKDEKWYCFLRGLAYKGLGQEHLAIQDFQVAWALPEGISVIDYLYDIAKQHQHRTSEDFYRTLKSSYYTQDTSALSGLALLLYVFPSDERVMEIRGIVDSIYSGAGPSSTSAG